MIDNGETGVAVKRPVFGGACPHGCPWGEIAEFVREAMKPVGYDVVICRNCNRDRTARLVSKAAHPPPLDDMDYELGTTERVDAPVDFGVTESGMLSWAYEGRYLYQKDGPYRNLRLIARIEDPTYLLVAVKADSDITNLAQIREKKMPVSILADFQPTSMPVLEYYGLTRDAVKSWGGRFIMAFRRGNKEADVIVSSMASPANNPESAFWTEFSQKHDLRFLELPEDLLQELGTETLGMQRVTVPWGLLRGVDRKITTVARSGEAIFGRDDLPNDFTYDAARAFDMRRGDLKWYIRPYSYDPQTVWKNFNVPLHPGAERYYREMGYMK
jgi:TRAP transporter TAXI family solute receptor